MRREERERSGTPIQDERRSLSKSPSRQRRDSEKNGGIETLERKNPETKWEKNDNISSDDNEELEKAYQKVEQTLAEQQFGVNAL